MKEDKNEFVDTEDRLFDAISHLIDKSRSQVSKAINTAMVYTYYAVGQYIVDYEQDGKVRAEYGKNLLKRLSARLMSRYARGWSVDTLENCRKFFLTYSISEPSARISDQSAISEPLVRKSPHFILPWTHYLILMREKNPNARHFYEIEASRQQWSKRQLQRQVASSLYERLAISKDKNEVMRLATEGQVVEKPTDILKNPLVLDFIGIKPDSSYSEQKLESAILDKLEDFLMECGKGFLFEARQKRFTFDEDNFYVDLVLYNRILQCYVLVDLKIDKLTHQDLGQMMMYVNYFDRYKRLNFEKPTIGILLCPTKNDAMVELTLPKEANIYAQEYALCLPKKEELKQKLEEWMSEYDERNL